MTNTFSGIRPNDVPIFIGAQFLGMGAAVAVFQWLLSSPEAVQPAEIAEVAEQVRSQP
jgi:hypothetical protein